ncbi:hypothetical protein Q8A73_018439, partial [Channa argus]
MHVRKDAWQAATKLLLMVWVSWLVAAPGRRQTQGTDVGKGGDGTLQDLCGIWESKKYGNEGEGG